MCGEPSDADCIHAHYGTDHDRDAAAIQELIANMLGVHRKSVTEVTGNLQAQGLIHYYRGKTTVLEHPKLQARVCECYAVMKHEYDRLLPEITAT